MANKWLTARAEVLMKYANELPEAVDKVTINIAAPDAGWIDFYFNVNGKEVTVSMMANIFSGEVPGFTVPIDSLGRFTLRIPIENTTCFTLTIQDRILAEIVAEPNETYFLMKDLPVKHCFYCRSFLCWHSKMANARDL